MQKTAFDSVEKTLVIIHIFITTQLNRFRWHNIPLEILDLDNSSKSYDKVEWNGSCPIMLLFRIVVDRNLHVFGQIIMNLRQCRVPCFKWYATMAFPLQINTLWCHSCFSQKNVVILQQNILHNTNLWFHLPYYPY